MQPCSPLGQEAHRGLPCAIEALLILQAQAVSLAQLIFITALNVPAGERLLHGPGVKNSILSVTVSVPSSDMEPCGFQ